jgi:hypothetical protein
MRRILAGRPPMPSVRPRLFATPSPFAQYRRASVPLCSRQKVPPGQSAPGNHLPGIGVRPIRPDIAIRRIAASGRHCRMGRRAISWAATIPQEYGPHAQRKLWL